jgi:hypothetical protein
MTLKKKTLLASLALAIVSLSACTQKPAPPGPAPNVATPGPGQGFGRGDKRVFYVSIYTDPDPAHADKCYADWPVATLWKDKNQTVQWISDDDKDYIVDFSLGKHGSPFVDPNLTFQVKKNGVKDSGGLSPSSVSGQYYDYGIRPGTNPSANPCKPASDPGLYVK